MLGLSGQDMEVGGLGKRAAGTAVTGRPGRRVRGTLEVCKANAGRQKATSRGHLGRTGKILMDQPPSSMKAFAPG